MIGNINAFLQQSFAWSTRDIYSTSVKVSRSGIASGGAILGHGILAQKRWWWVFAGRFGVIIGQISGQTHEISPKRRHHTGSRRNTRARIGVPLEAWAGLMLSRDFRLSIRRSFVNRGELAFIDLNFGLIYAGIIQFFNQKNAKKHQKKRLSNTYYYNILGVSTLKARFSSVTFPLFQGHEPLPSFLPII